MRHKLIFKRLQEVHRQVQDQMRVKQILGQDDSLENRQLAALKEIFSYITKGENWGVQEKSRQKIVLFLQNNCDYKKTQAALNAKSKNSVEVSISNLAKKLERKIGSNTIDLIAEGKVKEALVQFRTGTGKMNPKEYLVEGVLDLLPPPAKGSTILLDCEREIELMLYFRKLKCKDIFSKYDQDHLAYLLYVLMSTDRDVSSERYILYKLLNGNFESGSSKVKDAVQEALKEYIKLTHREK